ncbi:hypothetical protein RclHR1_18390003 [Rhizophagus clarus]|uniref:Kinase-like domain-containing protein n=1 Tax=Rhizophagus clarus TaxID=94130 RepID=A0A2Z6QRF3_9GLOM|nr:hypothetical protein RclHR1_18390003 [Rhizophagus clarus]GET00733.1 kinase-like domain-containing protein [Rhizophagus clarus]
MNRAHASIDYNTLRGFHNEYEFVKQAILADNSLTEYEKTEAAESHLNISVKYPKIVKCYGLTQNASNGNYMLVMSRMDLSLREYLQQNHNHLKWKERIKIAFLTINALYQIHEENSIHRDLNSGNILYSQFNETYHYFHHAHGSLFHYYSYFF